MCGRYVSPDTAAIEAQWHIGRRNSTPFPRRFNVAPAAEVPILHRDEGVLVLSPARWGLVPYWWRDAKPPRFSHNARLEEAATRPLWRDAMRRARCLVPALGWYEWRAADRQPYFFLRRDERLVALAGLMARWTDPATGESLLSCAILTTAAAGAFAAVHDRMPVTLPDAAAEAAWLESGATHVAADPFTFHPVSRLVNSSRAEGPELIAPCPQPA
ncbi:MAG TPA: SOS response-associated peptidase [Burkholderiales bacterium]|nr:SOS response-associated peptidase [Burkholderiales bacterium]